MMRARFLLICSMAALSACASVATQLPEVSLPSLNAERITQEDLAMTDYESQAKRLMRVAYPVLRENADLCPKTRADIGIWTHAQTDYDKRLRAASTRILKADSSPSVFQIAPSGPAAKAGINIGDMILGDDGDPIDSQDDDFQDALKLGETAKVQVLNNGLAYTKSVTPIRICDYNIRLRTSSAINAYADGRNITMTSGMMEFVKNDDELALIIGHELAHNTMGHIRKIIGNIILSGGATRYKRPFESESDYVGMYYLVRAGYSPENVEDVWRRLAKVNPKSVSRAKTHPTFPDRYLRIAAAREEIRTKIDSGALLIPNYKNSQAAKADKS